MAEVVRQISERLAALGHNVTVATSRNVGRSASQVNGVTIVEFAVSGNAVNGFQGDVAGYERFLLESRFDVVVNFAAQQWATDIALPLLGGIHGRKVFVPTGFSGLYSPRYRPYFARMPEWMRQYDTNVFLSDDYRDTNFARQNGVTKTVLIPNGAAADEFLPDSDLDIRQRLGIPEDHFLVLHVGSHTGLKGHSEALEIFRFAEIHHATLLVVANAVSGGCAEQCAATAQELTISDHCRSQNKIAIVTTLTRKETVAAYKSADLFLFPSNVECSPIVLFECMASQTPFLATNAGNTAEIIAWSGRAGLLLPELPPGFGAAQVPLYKRIMRNVRRRLGLMEDFAAVRSECHASAKLVADLYNDEGKRIRMAMAGFQAWQERFTWEKIARDYEALYVCLVNDTHA